MEIEILIDQQDLIINFQEMGAFLSVPVV